MVFDLNSAIQTLRSAVVTLEYAYTPYACLQLAQALGFQVSIVEPFVDGSGCVQLWWPGSPRSWTYYTLDVLAEALLSSARTFLAQIDAVESEVR